MKYTYSSIRKQMRELLILPKERRGESLSDGLK